MLKKIGLLLCSLIGVLGVLEVTLRILHPPPEQGWSRFTMGEVNRHFDHSQIPNKLLDYKGPEFHVLLRINNFGFRGKDIEFRKPPDTKRIFAIGDSFVFGVGAQENETIPFYIEQGLKKKYPKTEVINAGHGSYSPLLHYLKLRDHYLQFKPDLVLLFYDATDLQDDWKYEQQLIYDKDGNIVRCDPFYKNGKKDWWALMRYHSHACQYLHNRIVRPIEKAKILGLWTYLKISLEGKKAKAVIATMQNITNEDSIKYDQLLLLRGPARHEAILQNWPREEKYICMIRDLLKKQGIPMIWIQYPYSVQISPNQWPKGRQYWGFEPGKTYYDPWLKELRTATAQKNNIPYIRTYPEVKKHAQKHLYFDWDGHFTPVGNKIVAQAILKSPLLQKTVQDLFKSSR